MAVAPCLNICKNHTKYSFWIDRGMTPEAFDQRWKEVAGENTSLATASSEGGLHPMCIAAQLNQFQLIRHIYQKDKTTLDLGDESGWTPLLYAARGRSFEAVEALIELGVNVNVATIEEFCLVPKGATCLWYSVQKANNLAVTKLLLKFGAIEYPKLNLEAQFLLDKAKNELVLERQKLASDFSELSIVPTSLIPMILEYV